MTLRTWASCRVPWQRFIPLKPKGCWEQNGAVLIPSLCLLCYNKPVINHVSQETGALSKKHIFLSYCRENKQAVAALREDLLQAGEAVWWDDDILGGQNWKLEIRNAMRDAYAFIPCLSKEYEGRIQSGMYPELRDAIAAYRKLSPGSIYIIPIKLSPCSLPDLEIDDTHYFDSLQYYDLFGVHRDSAFDGLVNALQKASLRPN